MPNVPSVRRRAVEQAAIQHDAAADARRHDHRDEVPLAACGAQPALGQGEGLGVVVDVDRDTQRVDQPGTQREVPPPWDVQRRHGLAPARHRPATPDTAGPGVVTPYLFDGAEHRCQDHLRGRVHGGGAGSATHEAAVERHHGGRDLGAPDVNSQHGLHQSGTYREGRGVRAE